VHARNRFRRKEGRKDGRNVEMILGMAELPAWPSYPHGQALSAWPSPLGIAKLLERLAPRIWASRHIKYYIKDSSVSYYN
jgi:hypothetical protein